MSSASGTGKRRAVDPAYLEIVKDAKRAKLQMDGPEAMNRQAARYIAGLKTLLAYKATDEHGRRSLFDSLLEMPDLYSTPFSVFKEGDAMYTREASSLEDIRLRMMLRGVNKELHKAWYNTTQGDPQRHEDLWLASTAILKRGVDYTEAFDRYFNKDWDNPRRQAEQIAGAVSRVLSRTRDAKPSAVLLGEDHDSPEQEEHAYAEEFNSEMEKYGQVYPRPGQMVRTMGMTPSLAAKRYFRQKNIAVQEALENGTIFGDRFRKKWQGLIENPPNFWHSVLEEDLTEEEYENIEGFRAVLGDMLKENTKEQSYWTEKALAQEGEGGGEQGIE